MRGRHCDRPTRSGFIQVSLNKSYLLWRYEMDESVTLTPSRTKWLLMLLMCSVFTVGGVSMISDGESTGWFVAAFFGLGIPLGILQLMPASSYLRLDTTGFTMCSLWRKSTIHWRDVQAFGIWTVPTAGTKMVCYNLKPEAPRHTKGKLSTAMSGYEGGLPDTYRKSADDLLQIMENWRSRNSG